MRGLAFSSFSPPHCHPERRAKRGAEGPAVVRRPGSTAVILSDGSLVLRTGVEEPLYRDRGLLFGGMGRKRPLPHASALMVFTPDLQFSCSIEISVCPTFTVDAMRHGRITSSANGRTPPLAICPSEITNGTMVRPPLD